MAGLIDAPSLLKDLLDGQADLKSALVLLGAYFASGSPPESTHPTNRCRRGSRPKWRRTGCH